MITLEELEERAKSVGGRLESLSDINVLIEMRDYVAGLRGRPWSRPLRFGAKPAPHTGRVHRARVWYSAVPLHALGRGESI